MMYDYIWSRDQMRGFLKHDSGAVRSWASSRILEIYPDLCQEMLDFLPEADHLVAAILLMSVADLKPGKLNIDSLLTLYPALNNIHDKRNAAIILNRQGYQYSEKEAAELPLFNDLPLYETDPGFNLMLDRSLTDDDGDLALLCNVAFGCGAGDLFELMNDDLKTKKRVLKELADQWQITSPEIKGYASVTAAMKLLEEYLKQYPVGRSTENSRFPGLIQELESDLIRCNRLAVSIRAHLNEGKVTPPGFVPLLLTSYLGLVRNSVCRQVLSSQELTPAEFWRALTLRKWRTTSVDASAFELLQKLDSAVVISTLQDVLEGKTGIFYAGYAFRCLEAAAIPGRHELLLDALSGLYGIDIREDAEETVEDLRPPLVETALKRWAKEMPTEPAVWLRLYPTAPVVRHLAENFDYYFTLDDPRMLEEILEDIASPLFLDPLLNEWRLGETALADHIALLARINKYSHPRLEPIVREAESQAGIFESMKNEEEIADWITMNPLIVPLRCTVCRHIYHYPIKNLFLHRTNNDYVIGDIIQCKNCGSIETYTQLDSTLQLITMRLAFTMDMLEQGKIEQKDLPVKGYLTWFKAGNQRFKTLSEAYHYMRELVDNDPQNPELQRRLAIMLDNGGRPDLALPSYLTILQSIPDDINALETVVRSKINQKKFLDAAPYLERFASAVRSADIEDADRRNYFLALMDMAHELRREISYEVKLDGDNNTTAPLFSLDLTQPKDLAEAYRLFMGPSLSSSRERADWPLHSAISPAPREDFPKIGRNDPCPCGSGKKYKKCCGR